MKIRILVPDSATPRVQYACGAISFVWSLAIRTPSAAGGFVLRFIWTATESFNRAG